MKTEPDDDFLTLMARAGYDTKQKLAWDLGVTPTTVSRWRDNPPWWVRRYLQAMVEPRKLSRQLAECERRNRGLVRQIREMSGVVSPENRKPEDDSE